MQLPPEPPTAKSFPWGAGCAVLVGVVFVLFGGCTFLVFGISFANGDSFARGLEGLVPTAIGLAILVGGGSIIWAAAKRFRSPRR